MIVDEKQRYLKVAKILRIVFIVLLALLPVFVMVMGVIARIDTSRDWRRPEYYIQPLVLLFTALSLMSLLFQIVSKNSKLSCAVNLLFMLSAIVCAIMSAVHFSWSVVYVIAAFLGVYIILSGLFIIRGRYIVVKYPIATITLISLQLACACAAICMSGSIVLDRNFLLWIVVPSCITAFVLGVGIPAYLLSRSWWCDSCNRKNKGKAKFCCGCGKQRPAPQLPVKPKREKRVRPVAVVAATATQQTAPDQTAQQADWFCPECGTSNLPYAKFCESCGTKNPVDHF